MMRILIVEDDESFIPELTAVVNELPGGADFQVARSRDSALEALESNFFDLILLDLKIPQIDGYLTPDTQHGLAVFTKTQELAPGTPVFILTGSPAEVFVNDLLRRHDRVDIWGSGEKFGIVDFLQKWKFNEFLDRLRPMAVAVRSLSDVELHRTKHILLDLAEDRLLRIFTVRRGGAKCSLTPLSGLSGSKVLRLTLTGSDGTVRDHAVGKVGPLDDIEREADLYERHVSRLEPAATPRMLETIRYGAKDVAGVFYGLADGYDRTLFEAVRSSDAGVGNAIAAVSRFGRRWVEGVPWVKMDIAAIRRRLLSDASAREIFIRHDMTWAQEFEARAVSVKWCCIHGDLHGANVLLDPDCLPVIVDYGDVGEGPASLDPVTAELSTLCHPDGAFVGSGWPSVAQAAKWGSIEEYLVGCPNADFVRHCRKWADAIGAGSREIAASAYSYLLRQLKYADTNKDLTLKLLDGVYDFFRAT
jgi:CheY-like chemotaxis protein